MEMPYVFIMIEMLNNKIFLSVVLSVVVVQGIKIIIRLIKSEKLSWYDFVRTGGMPSSHSALVVSLVLSIFLLEGFSSTFIISAVLLVIVLRDAMGVRRTVGEEGKVLVRVAKKLKVKTAELHVSMGHTPMQVLVGSIIAIVVTAIVFLI